jgi:hypothetical protein
MNSVSQHQSQNSSTQNLRRFQRTFLGLFILASTGFLFFNTTRILQERKIDYVQDDFWNQSSLLYNTKYQQKTWNLNQFIFGNNARTKDSYNQFLSIQSQYEAQKNYGMVNAYTEQMYYLEMSSASIRTLELVQRNQAENIRDSLSIASIKEYLNNPEYSFLKTPVAVVGALAAFYTGRPVRFRLGGQWRLNAQSAGGSEARLALLSISRDGFSGVAARESDSQYRLLFNKQLGASFGATSAYKPSTQTTTVGISHALSEGWTVQYDRALSGTEKDQETVNLNFSKGF